MRESLRHSVTAHNWFALYLWDIYGDVGHNMKIIQRTLPSHTSQLTTYEFFGLDPGELAYMFHWYTRLAIYF